MPASRCRKPRVGLAAGAGGIPRLSRMIPLKEGNGHDADWSPRARQRGYELGRYRRRTPGRSHERSARWADEILGLLANVSRATKQVVMRLPRMGPASKWQPTTLPLPRPVAMVARSEGHDRRGRRPSPEKRKPNWKGLNQVVPDWSSSSKLPGVPSVASDPLTSLLVRPLNRLTIMNQ